MAIFLLLTDKLKSPVLSMYVMASSLLGAAPPNDSFNYRKGAERERVIERNFLDLGHALWEGLSNVGFVKLPKEGK